MITGKLTIGLLVFVPAGLCQSAATITGRVVTASEGSPIPKAQIHATNSSNGATFAVQSAADGRYVLLALPPGIYVVTAEFPPLFLPFRSESVQLEAGKTVQSISR